MGEQITQREAALLIVVHRREQRRELIGHRPNDLEQLLVPLRPPLGCERHVILVIEDGGG